ncbi:MAG: AAA family ATPase [Minisyncoccia bacterium]
MNLTEIQKRANEIYGAIFSLEDLISHRKRRVIERVLLAVTVLILLVYLFVLGSKSLLGGLELGGTDTKILGAVYISFSLWIIFFASNCFFYSYYFKKSKEEYGLFLDLDLAYVFLHLSSKDITGSFFNSLLGSRFLLRTGIRGEIAQKFLENRVKHLTADDFRCEVNDNILDLVDFVNALYECDSELQRFLFTEGIQKKDWSAIAMWIMEIHWKRHSLEGWWSKENLAKFPSLGQGWSYGEAYTLKKYERYLPFSETERYGVHTTYGQNEYEELQSVLAKNRQGNAILVSDDFSGQLQIIARLKQDINNNVSLEELKGRKVSVLDVDALTSSNGSKAKFESELLTILNEAEYAGNMIVVIDNLPAFIQSVNVYGSDLASLLEKYLNSVSLKFVALSSNDQFHSLVEKNGIFVQSFETIIMKEVDQHNTVKILENEIINYEARGMLFTYLALVEMVQSGERYFPNAVMPDKAIDILTEIVPRLEQKGKTIVERSDVQDLVEEKTGIPVGEVKSGERDKLLNLESILKERVVGQEEAIVAISNAMRKARSGIENPDRPLGSFLFLGPTGVGKTETTKALAEVFFGSSTQIERLDMSEYSGTDALEKLIGSYENGKPGVLSSMVREHPYGVLLLDEFEKTTKEVMNLFLQVLDEGYFSDGLGKKVMARNLIIIATSNAGSSIIWETMQSGRDLASSKEIIVNSIIEQRIYTPELLNRFDGVILFHPLDNNNLKKIAELTLKKLESRLAERGIDLVINESLINFIASKGTDPKFGARPINRAVSDEVEQIIAKKMISGEVQRGSTVELTESDFG